MRLGMSILLVLIGVFMWFSAAAVLIHSSYGELGDALGSWGYTVLLGAIFLLVAEMRDPDPLA